MTLSHLELVKLRKLLADVHELYSDEPLSEFEPLAYRDSSGDNCLHIAAWRSDIDAIKLLVKGGVDINAEGDNGYTPLDCALRQTDREIICYLLENGARCSNSGQQIRKWIKESL
ncbi:MAG: ankyrin repeat domain-containing protein [Acidiferrobacterales bacterium]|nr:ankyrin repeat domain-containing protein [Acidiferrobacterales bacterium]